MPLKIGITRFLGTNCDYDVKKWVEGTGHTGTFLWYQDQFSIQDYDAIVIPGGFSHGDYLRCGALAAKTQVMKSVIEFAKKGKPVLGICNGFQILCETELLPGVLLRNDSLKFIDKVVPLKVKSTGGLFSKGLSEEQIINLPIAHGEGHYFADSEQLKEIQQNSQVWLEYMNNPNGSLQNIAGICNKNRNVFALMPHPERALFDWMGSMDGALFL